MDRSKQVYRLQFELLAFCILWKEYIALMMVLNERQQRNKLYIPGVPYDKKCYLKFLMNQSKRKPNRKKIFNINLN